MEQEELIKQLEALFEIYTESQARIYNLLDDLERRYADNCEEWKDRLRYIEAISDSLPHAS